MANLEKGQRITVSAMPIKTLRARPASGKLFTCRLREGAGGRFNFKGNASAEFAVEGSGSFDVDALFHVTRLCMVETRTDSAPSR